MPWQRQRDIVRQTLKQKNTSTLGGHLILEKCAFSSPLKTHAVQVGFKNLDFKVFLQKKTLKTWKVQILGFYGF